jgi:hypothetical protein
LAKFWSNLKIQQDKTYISAGFWANQTVFVIEAVLFNQFKKELVKSGTSLKRQRKWAKSKPFSSNRLEIMARKKRCEEPNWEY